MRNELLYYYYCCCYELFHISQFVLIMLTSKMVPWRLRNVVFLAFIFSSYEFQVVKQMEGLNQGYGKKGRNVNAQSRETMNFKTKSVVKLLKSYEV